MGTPAKQNEDERAPPERANGTIGDSNTIENTILAYDPLRMLALKASKFPAGFPYTKVASST